MSARFFRPIFAAAFSLAIGLVTTSDHAEAAPALSFDKTVAQTAASSFTLAKAVRVARPVGRGIGRIARVAAPIVGR